MFPALLPEIANELTAHKSLDIFNCMGGVNLTHPELIADGCHPNAAGEHGAGRVRAACIIVVMLARNSPHLRSGSRAGYAFLAVCFQTALGL